MTKDLIKYLFISILLFPHLSNAQSLVWERSIIDSDNQSITAIVECDSGYLAYGTGRYASMSIDQTAELMKFDHAGNLLWKRKLLGPSINISNSKDIVRVKEENNFICSGRYIQGSTYDYIYKINSVGDTIWTQEFQYFGFFETMRQLLVLDDKSVVSVGWNQYPNTMADVIVRRIDSIGNLMWEMNYPEPGNQEAWSIVEMLDGSLILSGTSLANHFIYRIGFDGRLIDSTSFTISNGTPENGTLLVNDNNQLFFSGYDRVGGNSFPGKFIQFDTSLSIVWENFEGIASWIAELRDDGLFNRLTYTIGSSFISGIGVYDDTLELSSNYLPDFGSQRTVSDMYMVDSTILLVGNKDTAGSLNYWFARYDSVGRKWIPDRCAYQPPVAGFEYEYNYPLLTLRDTSSGGLKYLDTVYTWEWTSSLGQGGNTDSTEIFLDTAINKSLDIQLVISNWYGCMDTVNKTLNFDTNGISEFRELEVKIYPNPANDFLVIELSEALNHPILFELYDVQGVRQMEIESRAQVLRAQVSELPKGIYFYNVSFGTEVKRGKIIIQ